MTMRRLFRSRKQSVIGGVAGGLAEYFEVDVVLVRLLWVLAAFVGGGGVLAYIIAWVIIPEEKTLPSKPKPGMESSRDPEQRSTLQDASISEEARESEVPAEEENQDGEPGLQEPERSASYSAKAEEEHKGRRQRNAGLLLIGLGLIFLARQVLPAYFFQFSWPLLLILLGLFFLMRDRRETE